MEVQEKFIKEKYLCCDEKFGPNHVCKNNKFDDDVRRGGGGSRDVC